MTNWSLKSSIMVYLKLLSSISKLSCVICNFGSYVYGMQTSLLGMHAIDIATKVAYYNFYNP